MTNGFSTQLNSTHRNAKQSNATHHNTTQHNTTQHDTTRHDTTRHNTTRAGYTTAECFHRIPSNRVLINPSRRCRHAFQHPNGRTHKSLGNRSENVNLECQKTENIMESQRECEFRVPENRKHYGIAARMRIQTARTQKTLWNRSENANSERQRGIRKAYFPWDPQRECKF